MAEARGFHLVISMTQNAWNTIELTGNGKLLVGRTGLRPGLGVLTGCGMTVTNGVNSITLDTISTGLDYEKISSATASSSATIEFTGLSSTYHAYKIEIVDLIPATDGTLLYSRTSTDNGVSFDSGLSDYRWVHIGIDNDGSIKEDGDPADAQMISVGRTNDPIGNDTNETCSATLWIFNPSDTEWTKTFCQSTYVRTNGNFWVMFAVGLRASTTAVDAIQLLMSSGNITSGNFTLYGLKA